MRAGEIPTGAAARKLNATYSDYYREFSGLKVGQRKKEFEYVSRHGDIVDELTRWRPPVATKGERLVKNGYIDLGIEIAGKLTVIYEVKTNTGRQDLYGAIGQILVHGRTGHDLTRYVVLPGGQPVPADVQEAFAALGIGVLWFSFQGKRVVISKSS